MASSPSSLTRLARAHVVYAVTVATIAVASALSVPLLVAPPVTFAQQTGNDPQPNSENTQCPPESGGCGDGVSCLTSSECTTSLCGYDSSKCVEYITNPPTWECPPVYLDEDVYTIYSGSGCASNGTITEYSCDGQCEGSPVIYT